MIRDRTAAINVILNGRSHLLHFVTRLDVIIGDPVKARNSRRDYFGGEIKESPFHVFISELRIIHFKQIVIHTFENLDNELSRFFFEGLSINPKERMLSRAFSRPF